MKLIRLIPLTLALGLAAVQPFVNAGNQSPAPTGNTYLLPLASAEPVNAASAKATKSAPAEQPQLLTQAAETDGTIIRNQNLQRWQDQYTNNSVTFTF